MVVVYGCLEIPLLNNMVDRCVMLQILMKDVA